MSAADLTVEVVCHWPHGDGRAWWKPGGCAVCRLCRKLVSGPPGTFPATLAPDSAAALKLAVADAWLAYDGHQEVCETFDECPTCTETREAYDDALAAYRARVAGEGGS